MEMWKSNKTLKYISDVRTGICRAQRKRNHLIHSLNKTLNMSFGNFRPFPETLIINFFLGNVLYWTFLCTAFSYLVTCIWSVNSCYITDVYLFWNKKDLLSALGAPSAQEIMVENVNESQIPESFTSYGTSVKCNVSSSAKTSVRLQVNISMHVTLTQILLH